MLQRRKEMNTGINEKLKMIQYDLKDAFAEIGKKHGLQLVMGTMTYNELYFTMPVKGRFLDALGSTEAADKEEFELYARKFGLDPKLFGQTINTGLKSYKIVGIAPKARKYPVMAEAQGKRYKLTAESVIFAVGKEKQNVPQA
jgi:hypothetical protein